MGVQENAWDLPIVEEKGLPKSRAYRSNVNNTPQKKKGEQQAEG